MLTALLTFIFIRPFISSLAFPYLNAIYTYSLSGFMLIWIMAKGINKGRIRPLRYPLILFLAALLISALFSANKTVSLKELLNYSLAVSLFIISGSLNDQGRDKAIRVIILSGVIIGFLAIYQYFFGFRHMLGYMEKMKINDPFALDYIGRQRVFFPFNTPNTLAGYLIFVIPLALMLNNKKRYPALILLSAALYLTKSISALFSLSIGMGIYLYLRKDFSRQKLAAACILLFAFISIYAIRRSSIQEHTLPSFSLSQRLAYWQDTLDVFLARPLTGRGPGNLNISASAYTHNSYLQLGAETGILGLASFLWLISAAFRLGFSSLRHAQERKSLCPLIACSVFLIHNLLDFTFFLPEASLIWWAVIGLILTPYDSTCLYQKYSKKSNRRFILL